MDLDDFRMVLESSGVDVWTFIDTAITIASLDYGGQLKNRRDEIVERLYAATIDPRCQNCDGVRSNGRQVNAAPEVKVASPSTPQSDKDEELDPFGGLFDDEQTKILEIKEQLEDSEQSEVAVVDLLQSLADMDITFKALEETDIGRHVNHLRKHSSSDVRRLVKQLVRRWKDIVDEWVKLNQPGERALSALMDGDSPHQKIPQNGHLQVPGFAYSPNPHNGSSGSDKNNLEPEPRAAVVRRIEPLSRPTAQSSRMSNSAPQNRQREQKQNNFDLDRLASARKRLQDSYKEAENAKKQRTIQVMDIHDIPKQKNKNTFFVKNKGSGGSHSQARHW